MHGNAQWAMWNAFMMAGTTVLYTGHRFDPDRILRLISDERVMSAALVGRRHGPTAVRGAGRRPAGDLRRVHPPVIGSGGAMLSAAVKADLATSYPGP